ncbi:MAG: glucokinase [Lysobacter sp.]|nr:glucokinase [Lysobacter sp.]
MSNQRVLLADIGGTNARFALVDTGTSSTPAQSRFGAHLLDSVREFPVVQFPSLADAARHYLQSTQATLRQAQGEHHGIKRGIFAVAGRVDGDEARITNHPWVISRARTQAMLEFEQLHLINDFAAQALSIPLLESEDVAAIGGASWRPDRMPKDRTYAVIGPGTGLGVGGLLVCGGRAHALETEGGHTSFPPGTPEEIQILEHLSAQFGRVSSERLVSGPGLVNIHRALSEIASEDPGPMQPEDITSRAERGDARCMRTLDIFCAVFGAISGDLVLTLGAWDGVFLTGGLVPRLLPALQHSGFRQRFEHKGRFSSNMARVPTVAVLHPHPGLLGAAAFALAEQ